MGPLRGVEEQTSAMRMRVRVSPAGVGQRDQGLVVTVDELGLVLASPAHLQHALEHAEELLHVQRLLVDIRRALVAAGRGRPPGGYGRLVAQLTVLLA
eukprot:scaffold78211_cov63-Phaeocystis_antarctica.AAC.4